MGAIQLSDELERAIERQVAEGRATSPAEFLHEAVLRLIDDSGAEEYEVRRVAVAGIADAEARRYTVVATAGDEQTLHDRLTTRLRGRLAAQEQVAYRLMNMDSLEAALIEYRPVLQSDHDALASLWCRSWRSTGLMVAQDATENALRRRIDDEIQSGWDVTLALLDGQLAGFLALKLRSATLDQVFIAPALQGRGIGQKLLHIAKQRMPEGFSLRTAVANAAACRFYEKAGLTRMEVAVHPVLGHAVVTYCWNS